MTSRPRARRVFAITRRLCPAALAGVLIAGVASASASLPSSADPVSPRSNGLSALTESPPVPIDPEVLQTRWLAEQAAALPEPKPATKASGVGSAAHAQSIDVNVVVLRAHLHAASALAHTTPGCHLSWTLLAAIGQVESHNASAHAIGPDGTVRPAIVGPVLSGGAFASISDTDNGRWDGDTTWDRAVGPMQFIPATWARHGKDANHDGVANPNNVFDASLSSGGYLCYDARDLATPGGLTAAIFSYNHSWDYVRNVLGWMRGYAAGSLESVTAPALAAAEAAAARTAPPSTAPAAAVKPTPRPTTSASPTARPVPSPSASTTPSPAPTPTPTVTLSPTPTPSGSPGLP